jgi:hypothetical protein
VSAQHFRPGPWRCTTRRGSWDWVVYSAADPNIEICQTFHDGTELNELGEANARLIATAPRLYVVLEKAEALLKEARDTLVECATVPPKHDIATLDPCTRRALEELDAVLAEIRGVRADIRGGQ